MVRPESVGGGECVNVRTGGVAMSMGGAEEFDRKGRRTRSCMGVTL